jgi:hypothetical protein
MKLTLDYSCGLHEKANTDQFKQHDRLGSICAELLSESDGVAGTNLSRLLEVTRLKARIRTKQSYYRQLTRRSTLGPAEPEARLERALWINWGLHPATQEPPQPFLANVPSLLAYQVPLFNQQSKDSWGPIDLVGVSRGYLPVIIELKQEANEESPLRMLLQATAYAVSVQNAWGPRFRADWIEALKQVGLDLPVTQFPELLGTCQMVCLAPATYWEKWIVGKASIGPKGWSSFTELVSALESKHGLAAEFAALNMSVCSWRLPNISAIAS